jgi:hypothetical protein
MNAVRIFVSGVLLLIATDLCAACPQKHSRAATFVELSVPDGAPRPADANAFSVVNGDMTITKLFVAVGPPDASDGETTTIYVYCLPDGSEVRVGTRDGTTIDYVRHGRKELYKRQKK